MNLHWFKQIGIFFVPISLVGWIVLLAGIAFAVYSFIDIDSRSHSVSDTMMNFVFRLIIIGVVYSLIGYLTRANARKWDNLTIRQFDVEATYAALQNQLKSKKQPANSLTDCFTKSYFTGATSSTINVPGFIAGRPLAVGVASNSAVGK